MDGWLHCRVWSRRYTSRRFMVWIQLWSVCEIYLSRSPLCFFLRKKKNTQEFLKMFLCILTWGLTSADCLNIKTCSLSYCIMHLCLFQTSTNRQVEVCNWSTKCCKTYFMSHSINSYIFSLFHIISPQKTDMLRILWCFLWVTVKTGARSKTWRKKKGKNRFLIIDSAALQLVLLIFQ